MANVLFVLLISNSLRFSFVLFAFHFDIVSTGTACNVLRYVCSLHFFWVYFIVRLHYIIHSVEPSYI